MKSSRLKSDVSTWLGTAGSHCGAPELGTESRKHVASCKPCSLMMLEHNELSHSQRAPSALSIGASVVPEGFVTNRSSPAITAGIQTRSDIVLNLWFLECCRSLLYLLH